MKKIAIIGGGIAGLYFANLLQKSKNYHYKILEKKSKFELSSGYGIQLSVNSIKLLNEIRVLPKFFPLNLFDIIIVSK